MKAGVKEKQRTRVLFIVGDERWDANRCMIEFGLSRATFYKRVKEAEANGWDLMRVLVKPKYRRGELCA